MIKKSDRLKRYCILKNNYHLIFLIIAIVFYILIFSYVTVMRHWAYYSAYMDLGWFEQALWSTINGQFLYVSYIDASHFGTHNSPILFLLIPLYSLLPYSETLLIVQTVLLALGAIPLYFIGKMILDNWGGLIFSLSYLLYPGLHGINLFDFHELAFLPFLIFSAIFFLFNRRFKLFILFSILAMMVKEDVSILLFSLTSYAIFSKLYQNEKEKWILYAMLVLFIIWLVLSITWIIPLFNSFGYLHSSRYDLSHGIFSLVSNNFQLKIVYLILLFLPLGFTPLAAPEFLMVSFPSFAEILLQWPVAYRITTQYSALVIPIIFVASIMSIKKIQMKFSYSSYSKKSLYFLILIFSLFSCLFCTPAPVSPFTLYYNFSPNTCNYAIDDHVLNLNKAVDLIPGDCSVIAQNNIAGHLSRRMVIFIDYKQDVDYIIIDNKTKNLEWLNPPMGSFPLEKYQLIYNIDEIQVYKSKSIMNTKENLCVLISHPQISH